MEWIKEILTLGRLSKIILGKLRLIIDYFYLSIFDLNPYMYLNNIKLLSHILLNHITPQINHHHLWHSNHFIYSSISHLGYSSMHWAIGWVICNILIYLVFVIVCKCLRYPIILLLNLSILGCIVNGMIHGLLGIIFVWKGMHLLPIFHFQEHRMLQNPIILYLLSQTFHWMVFEHLHTESSCHRIHAFRMVCNEMEHSKLYYKYSGIEIIAWSKSLLMRNIRIN